MNILKSEYLISKNDRNAFMLPIQSAAIVLANDIDNFYHQIPDRSIKFDISNLE